MSSQLRSRVNALARRLSGRETNADIMADLADMDVFQAHTVAQMKFSLNGGTDPDPGPMPAAGQRWKDRQPPWSDEERAELRAVLRRMVGETETTDEVRSYVGRRGRT